MIQRSAPDQGAFRFAVDDCHYGQDKLADIKTWIPETDLERQTGYGHLTTQLTSQHICSARRRV